MSRLLFVVYCSYISWYLAGLTHCMYVIASTRRQVREREKKYSLLYVPLYTRILKNLNFYGSLNMMEAILHHLQTMQLRHLQYLLLNNKAQVDIHPVVPNISYPVHHLSLTNHLLYNKGRERYRCRLHISKDRPQGCRKSLEILR